MSLPWRLSSESKSEASSAPSPGKKSHCRSRPELHRTESGAGTPIDRTTHRSHRVERCTAGQTRCDRHHLSHEQENEHGNQHHVECIDCHECRPACSGLDCIVI